MRSGTSKSALVALLIAASHLQCACATVVGANPVTQQEKTQRDRPNNAADKKTPTKKVVLVKALPLKSAPEKLTVTKPEIEKPILTVSGLIKNSKQTPVLTFGRAELEAMGTESLLTTTPWHKGAVKFEGVRLSTLLKVIEASGKTLVVTALNDYSGEIPVEDAEKFDVLLALKADGRYMSVSDKGPIFVVYPFDAHPDLNNQKYYSRGVWQVNRIEVQ